MIMEKVFESLERLAMPDDLHEKECKRLGIDLTADYEIVKQYLLELKQIKEAEPSETLEYGKWYPISVYYENQDKLDLDWAFVQFKETKTGFMPLPFIAEYIKRDGVWTTHSDKDRYLCELCEPVAFMLWQPYKEVKGND